MQSFFPLPQEQITVPSFYRYALIMLVSFLLIYISACNPEEWEIVDCAECYTEQPEEAEINVKVSISNLNPEVKINIYSGKLEEEILILSDSSSNETWNTILPVNEYYTVTATYRAQTGNFMVTAIDGNLLRTRKVRIICDEPCWFVKGNNFNVRLKY